VQVHWTPLNPKNVGSESDPNPASEPTNSKHRKRGPYKESTNKGHSDGDVIDDDDCAILILERDQRDAHRHIKPHGDRRRRHFQNGTIRWLGSFFLGVRISAVARIAADIMVGFIICSLRGLKTMLAGNDFSRQLASGYSGIIAPMAYMPSSPLISIRVTESPAAMSPIIWASGVIAKPIVIAGQPISGIGS
jgi:hypothetical protein